MNSFDIIFFKYLQESTQSSQKGEKKWQW